MTVTIDDLKTAAELLEKAAELVHGAAKVASLPSEAARRSVCEEIGRIQLRLMLMRRDLTILRATANRRKSRKPQTGATVND